MTHSIRLACVRWLGRLVDDVGQQIAEYLRRHEGQPEAGDDIDCQVSSEVMVALYQSNVDCSVQSPSFADRIAEYHRGYVASNSEALTTELNRLQASAFQNYSPAQNLQFGEGYTRHLRGGGSK